MFDKFFKGMLHRAIAAVLFLPMLLIVVASAGRMLDVLYDIVAPIVPVALVLAALAGVYWIIFYRRRR
jgi:hypothetical protein